MSMLTTCVIDNNVSNQKTLVVHARNTQTSEVELFERVSVSIKLQ